MSECTMSFTMRMDFIKEEERQALYDELEQDLHAYDLDEDTQQYEKGYLFFRWHHNDAMQVDYRFLDWMEKVTSNYPQCGIYAVLQTYTSQTDYTSDVFIKYQDETNLRYHYYEADFEYARLYDRNTRYQKDVEAQYQQQILFYHDHTYYLLTRSELQRATFLDEESYAAYDDEQLLHEAMEDIKRHHDYFNYGINRKCIVTQKEAIAYRKQIPTHNVHLLIERKDFQQWLQDYGFKMDDDMVLLDFIRKEVKKNKQQVFSFWTMLIKKIDDMPNKEQVFDEAIFDPFHYLTHYYMKDVVSIFNDDDMITRVFFHWKPQVDLQDHFLCQLIKKGYQTLYHHIQEVGIKAYDKDDEGGYDDRLEYYLYRCMYLIHHKRIRFTKIDFLSIIENIVYLCDKLDLNDLFKNRFFLVTCKKYDCAIFELSGTSYCDYKRILHECKEQDLLQIVYETDNVYDPKAIRVETLQGLKIGYVPKEENAQLQGIKHYQCHLVRMYTSSKNHFIRVMLTNLD